MNDLRGFSKRYVFQGKLILSTALHIGGGRGSLSPTDSPVVRTPEGWPYIPGSSIKGAFRATVEKLSAGIPGLKSCGLAPGQGCVGAQGDEQEDFQRRRREQNWKEGDLLKHLRGQLCDTCKLFGSPFMASRIFFHDLPHSSPTEAAVQIRDGVAIDRDSERAVDRLKFDFEVVSAGQSFDFFVQLDEPDAVDLGLACVGLSEYGSGFGHLGGKRSRGLGAVRLEELSIYELDLAGKSFDQRAEKLKRYLLGTDLASKMDRIRDTSGFLNQQIGNLLVQAAATREVR